MISDIPSLAGHAATFPPNWTFSVAASCMWNELHIRLKLFGSPFTRVVTFRKNIMVMVYIFKIAFS